MYQEIRRDLASLRVYRNVLDDELVKKLVTYFTNVNSHNKDDLTAINAYNDLIFTLFQTKRTFREHLVFLILHDDNPFSSLAENMELEEIEPILLKALKHDLAILGNLFGTVLDGFQNASFNIGSDITVENLHFSTHNDWTVLVEDLANYYKKHSRGLVSKYLGFYWDRNYGLKGISKLPRLDLADLVGCDLQINKLKDNTLRFLQGLPANNVLLYGPRGTGKSTAVKALLNEYCDEGLRIVEVFRDDLDSIPELLAILKDYNLKFILFLDDLSFEDYETGYKGLKAVLEGTLEATPDNVLIYATSNRRHLVKEYFADRARPALDEIHVQDTVQEKLSLSDRFGLTLTFPIIDKNTYLQIVNSLVEGRNIKIPPEDLERLAIEWERANHGPSGRTALQFVNSLGAGI